MTPIKPTFFLTQQQFREWLITNGEKERELWVGFYKKHSGKGGMNYDQALDEALCFGWIDGLVKRYDDLSYMQRFTPRRPKSVWSKINTQHVARLIEQGKMMSSGLAAVEAAKKMADGFIAEKIHIYTIVYQLQKLRKKEQKCSEYIK